MLANPIAAWIQKMVRLLFAGTALWPLVLEAVSEYQWPTIMSRGEDTITFTLAPLRPAPSTFYDAESQHAQPRPAGATQGQMLLPDVRLNLPGIAESCQVLHIWKS